MFPLSFPGYLFVCYLKAANRCLKDCSVCCSFEDGDVGWEAPFVVRVEVFKEEMRDSVRSDGGPYVFSGGLLCWFGVDFWWMC